MNKNKCRKNNMIMFRKRVKDKRKLYYIIQKKEVLLPIA